MNLEPHAMHHVSKECRSRILASLSRLHDLKPHVRRGMYVNVRNDDGACIARMRDAVAATPHVAMLASKGRNMLMVLTRDETAHPEAPGRCLLVDSTSVFSVRLAFDSSLFDGDTVFEGELVSCDGKHTFLVDDILVIRGTWLPDRVDLRDRHATALDIVENGHAFYPGFDTVRIVVKRPFLPHDMMSIIEFADKLPYPSTSVLLRPMFGNGHVFIAPLYSHPSLSHVSPQHAPLQSSPHFMPPPAPPSHPLHQPSLQPTPTPTPTPTIQRPCMTVMLARMTDMPDVYEVCRDTKTRGTARAWSQACVPTLAASKIIRAAFSGGHPPGSQLVKVGCVMNDAFNRWEPVAINGVSFRTTDVA